MLTGSRHGVVCALLSQKEQEVAALREAAIDALTAEVPQPCCAFLSWKALVHPCAHRVASALPAAVCPLPAMWVVHSHAL